MQKQSNKNLLVCLTPLQMLIALKIIEQNPAVYDVLCISYNQNEKYDYYFDKLSKMCQESYKFIIHSERKIFRIFDFLRFKFFLFHHFSNRYNTIFVASIDNPFLHLSLSHIKKKNIITFDDGSANINKDSVYYKYIEKSKMQRAVLKFLGNNYNISKIISESDLHYTIYEDSENVVKNTTFISLFSELKENLNKKKIKIFLGQPLNEIKGINIDKIFKFLLSENVKYYFPHPRERSLYKEFTYINSSLIFEDYILELLREDYYIEIYTILSTAAINVASLSNVNIYVLHQKELNLFYPRIFDLFSKMRNCNMCEL